MVKLLRVSGACRRVRSRKYPLTQLMTLRYSKRGNRRLQRTDLEPALDALHQPEEDGDEEDEDGDPEGVPLHAVAAVEPPLRQRPRARLVEGLLEDHEAVVPVREGLEAPLVRREAAALGQQRV